MCNKIPNGFVSIWRSAAACVMWTNWKPKREIVNFCNSTHTSVYNCTLNYVENSIRRNIISRAGNHCKTNGIRRL